MEQDYTNLISKIEDGFYDKGETIGERATLYEAFQDDVFQDLGILPNAFSISLFDSVFQMAGHRGLLTVYEEFGDMVRQFVGFINMFPFYIEE